jgi:hypothetical protein
VPVDPVAPVIPCGPVLPENGIHVVVDWFHINKPDVPVGATTNGVPVLPTVIIL